MLSLNREQSKAQHGTAQSPLHKAANHVRVDQSTYQKKYVRTCMLRPVCFPGARSSWHLQVACLHLKCWTIYFLHLSVIPIHSSFRASVAGGTARYAKRLVETYHFVSPNKLKKKKKKNYPTIFHSLYRRMYDRQLHTAYYEYMAAREYFEETPLVSWETGYCRGLSI